MGKKVKEVPMTDKSPDPTKRGRLNNWRVKGISSLETLIKVQIPEVMSAAEIAYCSKGGQKGNPQTENRKTTRGGVIKPPTMAKQCCKPMSMARKIGIGSSVEGWVGEWFLRVSEI